jgi:metal-responsive CopG/Arc/MetJ family transcriptional regulator
MKKVLDKQEPCSLTFTMSKQMAHDFGEITAKIGWSRSTVIRRCLKAAIQAVKQFDPDAKTRIDIPRR